MPGSWLKCVQKQPLEMPLVKKCVCVRITAALILEAPKRKDGAGRCADSEASGLLGLLSVGSGWEWDLGQAVVLL